MGRRISCLALAAILGAASPALAQDDQDAGARLVFLAADPAEGRPGAPSDDLGVLSLDTLPEMGAAELEVLGALLRSSPVSTFMATPDAPAGAQTGEMHLVLDLALSDGAEGPAITLGGEAMDLAAFGDRLGALVGAFNPRTRQIAYLRLHDPEDLFATALPALRGAIDPVGFGMAVLMVGPDPGSCDGIRTPVHYSLLGGLADSAPFGDGDGATSVGEAMEFVAAALERDVDRGAPCAARYSLILRGDENPGRVVVTSPAAPLFPEMETAVYRERFQALFLMSSEDEAQIRDYLETCTYCPSEAALSDRLREIGERQLALRLEQGIWEGIRDDETGDRIAVYLENCQLCAFRDEAEARLERFEAVEAARAQEAVTFAALSEAGDLNGLRDWLSECVACEQAEDAATLISELENDSRVAEERAALDEAISRRNADQVREWLDTCEICAARDEAEAALADFEAQVAAAGPCLSAAGLPQQGGPRLLSQIDQTRARAVCGSALTSHPGNPLAVTALGRVEQAAGNLDEARAAYQAGIDAGIPAAFGLAAHSLYAPGDGGLPDYPAAEALAIEGEAQGDWLSAEVLTVLYSRELIEGKGAAEAFDIALATAERGNPVSQFFAGYFYRIGSGIPQNDRAAAEWLEKSVAQGYLHAASFLAEIYEEGAPGVPEDGERAAELYWEALSAGDPTTLDRLANQINDRSSDVVAGLQTRLREAGVFTGRVDGIGGNNTASAIRRYAASVAEN